MRAKILDLAIQGKLTDQREEDGNARDLLKEIQAEKEKLIKEKKIKKGKPLPEITEEEKPFEIPDSWEWVRLGDICQINPRNHVQDENVNVSFLPMALIGEGYGSNYCPEIRKWKDVKKGFTHFANNDVVLAKISPCFQNLKSAIMNNLINGIGAGTTELHVLRRYSHTLDPKYLLCFVQNQSLIKDGIKTFKGVVGQQRIGKDFIKEYLCPLPPLAEQKRIADKVSALFAQLDSIDKAYEEYRELQQTMKTKLLDLAIQGKLTDQRAEDGNARDLLKEIQAEKDKLIKEKKIKKEKPLPEITEEEKPFDIPENWMWVRLGEMILNHIGGGTPDKSNEAYWNGDIPWMSVKDVHQDSMYADRTIDSITPAGLENSSSNLIEANRLIVVMRMAVGRAVINKLPVAINQDLRALFFRDNVTQEYILRIFKILKFETSGMTVKGIKLWVLLNTPIPLPPLAEQKRIVAKLDELLPLCNVPGVYSKGK